MANHKTENAPDKKTNIPTKYVRDSAPLREDIKPNTPEPSSPPPLKKKEK